MRTIIVLRMRDRPEQPDGDARGNRANDGGAPQASVRRVTSKELIGPAGMLEIEHAGRIYCLRITQQGKLILTA